MSHPNEHEPDRKPGDVGSTVAATEAVPTKAARGVVPPAGFVLLEEVGSGGMGRVYRARDLALDRDVALKFLKETHAANSAAAARFLDEARITGQLQHPGVPAVYQVGTLPDGRPFLAMKLIRGQTLQERLTEQAGVPNWLAIFEALCQAVGYAHAHNVIHRDLKPQNVMVGAFGEVQVVDWGLAKVLSAERAAVPQAVETSGMEIRSRRGSDALTTQAGTLLGTPAYMAPEQAAGAVDHVGRRADVFSLGAILCVLLTGGPPYNGDDAEEVRLAALRGKLDDAFARLDACGAEPGLVVLAKRCLAAEPAGRPADANAVAEAVAGLRADAEERARKAELDRARAEVQVAEQGKLRKVQMALATVLLVVVAGAGAGAWWYQRQQVAVLARQMQTVSGVTAALEDARRRVDEGWGQVAAPDRMRTTADLAAGAVDRAAGLLQVGEATPELLASLRTTRAASDDLSRHAALFVGVERIFQDHAQTFDSPNTARRLAEALRAFGLDLSAAPDVVAGQVAASRFPHKLLGFVGQWAFQAGGAEKARAQAIFRLGHVRLGGAVADWQAAVAAMDRGRLARLAASPEVLAVGPELLMVWGHGLIAVGSRESRLNLLRRAARHYPENVWVHWDLFRACMEGGPALREEALRHIAAAVALRPDSARFHVDLGNYYRGIKRPAQAVAELRQAVRINGKVAAWHADLASALYAAGDWDGTIAACKQAIGLTRDPRLLARIQTILGMARLRKSEVDAAPSAGQEAVRLDPTSAAHNCVG
jgi:tRNA A-37 threonylcarbamoyl transferase component Bud32/tetratricopeptide (TPR) repeat protein